MAVYEANSIKHATTVAGVVDEITLHNDYSSFEVINRGTDDLYFRSDGSDPVVGGDDCEIVPGGASVLILSPGRKRIRVKVVSVGATPYSIAGRPITG